MTGYDLTWVIEVRSKVNGAGVRLLRQRRGEWEEEDKGNGLLFAEDNDV